jgi:hypothetical protein
MEMIFVSVCVEDRCRCLFLRLMRLHENNIAQGADVDRRYSFCFDFEVDDIFSTCCHSLSEVYNFVELFSV